MTNLEKIAKHEINSLFIGGYEWSFIAKARKRSRQRIDFDIVSLDGSYIFHIIVRASLLGLKIAAYHKQEHSNVWTYERTIGPDIAPGRKKFVKDNLEKVLLHESFQFDHKTNDYVILREGKTIDPSTGLEREVLAADLGYH